MFQSQTGKQYLSKWVGSSTQEALDCETKLGNFTEEQKPLSSKSALYRHMEYSPLLWFAIVLYKQWLLLWLAIIFYKHGVTAVTYNHSLQLLCYYCDLQSFFTIAVLLLWFAIILYKYCLIAVACKHSLQVREIIYCMFFSCWVEC